MRVGLLRHFPVSEPMPRGWMTGAELHEWRRRYDEAKAHSAPVASSGIAWARCYSSDLSRAYVTAQAVHAGDIVRTDLLREPDVAEFRTGGLRLPFWVWRWVLRFAWMTAHRSQRRSRDDFFRRVRAVADLIESADSDVLLVSHAGMMAYLRRELARRGFEGPAFRIAEHARWYVFHRSCPTGAAPCATSSRGSRRSMASSASRCWRTVGVADMPKRR
jgi:hypothetical protein